MVSSQQIHRVQPIERFPTKPRADGRFQKRIKGRLYYFGQNGNRQAALVQYDLVKNDLYSGRRPRPVITTGTLTAKELANLFTAEKEAELAAGDISPGHMADYRSAIRRFLKYVGTSRLVSDLRPDDFAGFSRHLRSTLGPHAFNRNRACIVAMLNHADACGWIPHPVRVGKGFKKASAGELRGVKKRRFFQPSDVRKLIDKTTDPQLKAMILLGVNAGFGATDCSLLERKDIDLAHKRVDTIRNKRNTLRSFPLWPETVAALRAVMAERPDDSLVFRKVDGKPWVQDRESANINAVTKLFADLCDRLKLHRPKGVSFGALRHTFATLANRRQDPDAYKRIMGHKLAGLDDVYVEDIDWPRLKKITDHVRSLIFSNRGSSPSRDRQRARAHT